MYIKETSAGLVKVASLPNQYESETINCAGGFATLSDAIHEREGFYKLITPEYNSDTHRLGAIELKDGVCSYKVEAIPAIEIARRGWHHTDFAKRIVAPSALINQYPNIAIWMQLNELPIILSNDKSQCYLYMNVIEPQHQQLVDSLEGVLTIENIPI